MTSEVVMPRLGWTMEAGTIVQWLKRDGEMVNVGDSLLEIEGDKAVTDVEALESGVLRFPPDAPEIGAEVPVGTLLAYLVPVGDSAPFERAAGGAAVSTPRTGSSGQAVEPDAHTDVPLVPAAGRASVGNGAGEPAISPRARRVAGELGLDWTTLRGSGSTGRIVESDVRAAAKTRPQSIAPAPRPPRVSPLARRVAENAGIELAAVAPAAPDARITRADVEAVAHAAARADAPAERATPMSQTRRVIATRMAESAHTAAAVTLTTEADATELVRLRGGLVAALGEGSDAGGPVPSYTDLLVRLTALALVEHPALNASLRGDQIVRHAGVHIGVAVDTERGLLVPVIRDAHAKSVGRIAAESAGQIAQARAGRAAPDDLHGGTFTITNLGMYDIDAFTPIINPPECAILGVGRIAARPVVVDEAAETVAVRKMMALSLTFDHRVVDGAPAARFLRRVKQFVEMPLLWLTR